MCYNSSLFVSSEVQSSISALIIKNLNKSLSFTIMFFFSQKYEWMQLSWKMHLKQLAVFIRETELKNL